MINIILFYFIKNDKKFLSNRFQISDKFLRILKKNLKTFYSFKDFCELFLVKTVLKNLAPFKRYLKKILLISITKKVMCYNMKLVCYKVSPNI
jgi:hypothetical protein